jgi:hypothetical protein
LLGKHILRMKLPKIQPGIEFKQSERQVLALVEAVKERVKKGKIYKNPIQSRSQEHPEVRAYRNRVAKKGRYLAQAYLKEISAQAISTKRLQSSQDIIYAKTLQRFLKHPEQINRPQLTRRYGTEANGFKEYAIVGITSDGKNFVIDGNHRISAARKLHKKVKVKKIDLKEFLQL